MESKFAVLLFKSEMCGDNYYHERKTLLAELHQDESDKFLIEKYRFLEIIHRKAFFEYSWKTFSGPCRFMEKGCCAD